MAISSTADSLNWQLYCTIYCEYKFCHIYARSSTYMYKILILISLKHNQCAVSFLFHIVLLMLASLQELTLFLKPRQSNNHVRPCHPSPENYARLPPVQSVLRPEVVRFHIYLGRHRCASHNPIHTFTATTQVSLLVNAHRHTCQNNAERREKKKS